jgi:hypothetical protein
MPPSEPTSLILAGISSSIASSYVLALSPNEFEPQERTLTMGDAEILDSLFQKAVSAIMQVA